MELNERLREGIAKFLNIRFGRGASWESKTAMQKKDLWYDAADRIWAIVLSVLAEATPEELILTDWEVQQAASGSPAPTTWAEALRLIRAGADIQLAKVLPAIEAKTRGAYIKGFNDGERKQITQAISIIEAARREGREEELKRIYHVDKKTLLRNWQDWNREHEKTEWAAT